MDGNQNMTPNGIYGDGGRYSRSKCLKEAIPNGRMTLLSFYVRIHTYVVNVRYVLTCANIN